MSKKLTTEEFIKKAREVHGDKYDYSKVEYVDTKTKVIISCPIHGDFEQSPNSHLSGKGCFLCGNINKGNYKKLSTEKFIEKAKKIHGDKFDYSKVEYVNNCTKVCIISPTHGEFWIAPNNHLFRSNASKYKDIEENTKKFIEKAKEVYGDKFDYSKTRYIDSKTKVCVICKKHGEFWQRPDGHLKGNGCSYCNNRNILTTEEFIKRAIEKHGDKYDYSKVNYINSKTKVCIICKKHGEFWQDPINHLRGIGCAVCKSSILEKNTTKILTENNINFEYQKQFDWLKKQSLDFYLTDYNIAIECQGKQHFKSIGFFGGEEAYTDRIDRDERKYNLCKNNNIKLLYFTNVNENLIPKTYFDTIYRNENDLLNAIKEYGNNTRT